MTSELWLYGRFGMLEMEQAARRIIQTREEQGYWGTINDMQTDLERIGYVELVTRSWFEKGSYNGEFIPSDHFLKRMKE